MRFCLVAICLVFMMFSSFAADTNSVSTLGTNRGGGEIMTNAKIISLVAVELSDDLVIQMIRGASRTRFDLTAEGVIALKKANVSEAIIKAMWDIWEKQRQLHDRNIRIFTQLLASSRTEDYHRAVRELTEYGSYAVPLLIDNLRNKGDRIRAGCADVLGRIGDEVAIDALFATLVDRNRAVRARAAKAVASYNLKLISARLSVGIKDKESFRDGYALAIGFAGDVSQTVHLIKLLKSKAKDYEMAAAAYALGLLGESKKIVLEALQEGVLNEQYRELRESSARALGKLSINMTPLIFQQTNRAMIVALNRYAPGREIIAFELSNFPSRRTVLALMNYLDFSERAVAIAAWDALRVATGEEQPRDKQLWQSWWQLAEMQPRWQDVEIKDTEKKTDKDGMQEVPEIPEL